MLREDINAIFKKGPRQAAEIGRHVETLVATQLPPPSAEGGHAQSEHAPAEQPLPTAAVPDPEPKPVPATESPVLQQPPQHPAQAGYADVHAPPSPSPPRVEILSAAATVGPAYADMRVVLAPPKILRAHG